MRFVSIFKKLFPVEIRQIVIVVVLLSGYSLVAFAAAPSGGYVPGETLNPNCSAGDADCSIRQGWVIDRGTGSVYNTTDFINIGLDDGTLPLTVSGGFMNVNETVDGFTLVTTADSILGQPGFFVTSASSGLTEADFFADDYTGFTGNQGNINNIGGTLELVQKKIHLRSSRYKFIAFTVRRW